MHNKLPEGIRIKLVSEPVLLVESLGEELYERLLKHGFKSRAEAFTVLNRINDVIKAKSESR